jgi:hypothetical protein
MNEVPEFPRNAYNYVAVHSAMAFFVVSTAWGSALALAGAQNRQPTDVLEPFATAMLIVGFIFITLGLFSLVAVVWALSMAFQGASSRSGLTKQY